MNFRVKNLPRFDPRVEPVVCVFQREGGDGDVRVTREDDEGGQCIQREGRHGRGGAALRRITNSSFSLPHRALTIRQFDFVEFVVS